MAPLGLLDLPNEVLTLVCRNLCGHCQDCGAAPTWAADVEGDRIAREQRWQKKHKDLATLCLASKRLRDIAQPVLHHRLRADNIGRDVLVPFAQTVTIRRPDLANVVYKLDLEEFVTDLHTLREDEVPVFNAAAERLGLIEKGQTCGDVKTGGRETEMAWVLALLAHVPKLEQLHTVVASSIEDAEGSTLYQLARQAESLPPLLPSVWRLSLAHWDTEYGFDLDQVTPLMQLMPNLRKLELFACLGGEELAPGSLSTVRELRVRHSAFTKESLDNLLQACGPLEMFVFGNGSATVSQAMDEPEFYPRHAVAALLENGHGKTLRRFELDYTDCEWVDDEPGEDDVLGDMRGFQVLETLRVSSDCLYVEADDDSSTDGGLLINTLPESLRYLAILGTHRHIYEDLMALAHSARTKFPLLKNFDLHADWVNSGDALREEQVEAVQNEFKAAGVAFTNRNWIVLPSSGLL